MTPVCLSIAGSDSSAGAGIQADIKTFSSLGCYGATVITAVTAQNTAGIRSIHAVPPENVGDQLNAVLEDMPVAAIKIGMLADLEIVRTIIPILHRVSVPIIFDPVRFSSSGTSLLEVGRQFLIREFMPLCALITPNVEEATWLAGIDPMETWPASQLAEKLIDIGFKGVLVTGGDCSGAVKQDCLAIKENGGTPSSRIFEHSSIATSNHHGTGCTLSSAIAAFTAKDLPLVSAVNDGIDFVQTCLKQSISFTTGKGIGGLDHFSNTPTANFNERTK